MNSEVRFCNQLLFVRYYQQLMLNYFLNQQEGGLTSQKRKIIEKKILFRRKYNPFHIECQYTKKKLCYCKKHPLSYLTQAQKIHLWTNSYAKQHEFFEDRQFKLQPSTEVKGKINMEGSKLEDEKLNKSKQKQERLQKQKKLIDETKRQFDVCVEKIRGLSQQQLTKFIKQYSRKYRGNQMQVNDNHASAMY